MNNVNGKDLWAEFRAVQTSFRKKLLKKPNYHEFVGQYRRLANSMEEAELFDQAALCHREIASVYAKIENYLFEQRHLLKAAKLFYSAQMQIRQTHSQSTTEFGQLMEENYLEVIQSLLKHNSTSSHFHIVGLTFFELANRFSSLEESYKSFTCLQRANRFLQGDIPIQIKILQNLCDLSRTINKEHREELMAELTSIWISLPKSDGLSLRDQLLALEAKILLLHLIFSDLPKRQFLTTYGGSWKDARRNSVTTKEEFHLFSQFIGFVQEENYLKASEMFCVELGKLMDSDGKRLCKQLIDNLNIVPTPNDDFDEIIQSSELSELQKRDKMFELFSERAKSSNSNCFPLENLF